MAEEFVVKLTADLFKSLGHPVRIRILQMLEKGELCVCEMIDEIGIEQSNLSQHLGVLKKQGLIESRKEGQWVRYWLASPSVTQLVKAGEQILRERIDHSQSLLRYLSQK